MLRQEEPQMGVIPVPANIQPGAQTAQWVLDQITTYPDTFDMSRWSDYCGTTHCMAGWAASVHPGILEKHEWNADAAHMDARYNWESAGAEALNLAIDKADEVFYLSERAAIRALRFIAKGEDIDMNVVLGMRDEN